MAERAESKQLAVIPPDGTSALLPMPAAAVIVLRQTPNAVESVMMISLARTCIRTEKFCPQQDVIEQFTKVLGYSCAAAHTLTRSKAKLGETQWDQLETESF
jgi:hypothetical protein